MNVLHISDWHTDAEGFKVALSREVREEPRMAKADLIVLSGDMVFNTPACRRDPSLEGQYQKGAFDQMLDFLDVCFPGIDVVGVRGNHDYFDYGIRGDSQQGVEVFSIAGWKVASMRGVPLHMGSWNDEFVEGELDSLCNKIPRDTQILITHAPSFGILDDTRDVPTRLPWDNDVDFDVMPRNIGSEAFRKLVDRMPNLRLHMFGHVHEQGGRVEVRGNVIYSNASCTANFVVLE